MRSTGTDLTREELTVLTSPDVHICFSYHIQLAVPCNTLHCREKEKGLGKRKIFGISLGYIGDILRISWEYLRDKLLISFGYFGLGYLWDIFGISQTVKNSGSQLSEL